MHVGLENIDDLKLDLKARGFWRDDVTNVSPSSCFLSFYDITSKQKT